jgi:predicted neuraminidase
LTVALVSARAGDLTVEAIFPQEPWHNHASSIVETPRGDLFVCWFHGSGERKSDDVRIEASRLRRARGRWETRFVLNDTPGFPDCNPCLFVDPKRRLWLFNITLVANIWESSILTWKRASSYERLGRPAWEDGGVLLLKPGQEFETAINVALPGMIAKAAALRLRLNDKQREELDFFLGALRSEATNTYYRRMGWMTRVHPTVLSGGRWLLPLYHDGFSCAAVARSDDSGVSWTISAPIIGMGGVQPSLAQRRDGTVAAIMRDNGPPPARAQFSESRDFGVTWSDPIDTEIPNPGSSLEWIVLRSGRWLLVLNDTERSRRSMAAWLSDDEGRTWRWRRGLSSTTGDGGFGYPSVIQAHDGSIHVTYSAEAGGRSTILHARFDEAWLLAAK